MDTLNLSEVSEPSLLFIKGKKLRKIYEPLRSRGGGIRTQVVEPLIKTFVCVKVSEYNIWLKLYTPT